MAPRRKKAPTGGGQTSNPPQKEIQVRIDPDLLNCSICFHPLCSPVNQCNNGHVACSSCWTKLKHKCHLCKAPVVSRSIALDKILESVHVPCTYAHLGCLKYVSYSQMQVHIDTCEFAPSLCPILGRAHKASSGEWRTHFIKDHHNTIPDCYNVDSPYNYGESYIIRYDDEDLEEDQYYTFLGPSKDVFLLVKEAIPNIGNALSLYYIDLTDLGRNYFECELSVAGGPYLTSLLQSKSQVVSIKEWKRSEVHGSSLVLPSQFLLEKYMEVEVLINKKKC